MARDCENEREEPSYGEREGQRDSQRERERPSDGAT